MSKGSKRAEMVFEFINEQIKTKGYPPTVREICTAVGLKSTSSAHGYLKLLADQGKIQIDGSKNRALRLVDSETEELMPTEFLPVPVIGTITAGAPILAQENVTDVFPMPMTFAKNKDIFMLKVRGESMINAGILDGDYVIVESRPDAINGDIVVALIEDSATVKTFYKENGHFRLQPENDFMDPIIVNEVSVLGKVVGVFRQM